MRILERTFVTQGWNSAPDIVDRVRASLSCMTFDNEQYVVRLTLDKIDPPDPDLNDREEGRDD